MDRNLSKSLEETYDIAGDFVDSISAEDSKALVVGLYGDLGSGKTTFVQGVAKKLGIEENITSPTFVIQKIYKIIQRDITRQEILKSKQSAIRNQQFSNFVHIDAYRLESSEEIKKLGWEEIIKDPKNLILVEWPENIKEVIPNKIVKIKFKVLSETQREIEIKFS